MARTAIVAVIAALLAGVGVTRAQSSTIPATRGVVLINTDLALQGASAAGSGVVLTKSGEVLTNNHVIRGATTIKVTVPATHRTYTATVLGYDIVDDLALLKLQGAANLATVTRGNSSTLKVGQLTRAVGNAEGGGKLVTTVGQLRALNRTISVTDDNGEVRQLKNLIETTAKLVPGDSGGPLLDSSGRVIGIDAAGSATLAFSSSSPGYAIPINRASTIAKQIDAQKSSSTVHIGATAFIGLTVQDTPQGVLIGQIVPNTPAESAGLQQGDVITSLDGSPVQSYTDLRTLLFTRHPGDTVTLGFTTADGSSSTATFALTSGPPQ